MPNAAPPLSILPIKTVNARLVVVCFAAASVGLSMAIISIAKLLLLLFGLAALLIALHTKKSCSEALRTYTPMAVLMVLLAFAASLLWTVAPLPDALGSLAKYGKLLAVVLIVYLVRDRREALYAVGAFGAAQIFLVWSSWLLFLQVPVPWATSNMALTEYAVFSSYLDQGIMSAVLAALCWHLRELLPSRVSKAISIIIAVLALANVFFVLSGRSGHVVAISLLSLAIMWELPKRFRAAVLVLPFILGFVLFASSTKVRDRLTLVQTEVQSHSDQTASNTSTGVRLRFWQGALEILAQHPVAGAGVGSWSTEHNRVQRVQNPAHVDIQRNGNPHQEYLMWGVQLGIPGIALLLGLMASVWRDTLPMDQCIARSTLSVLSALAIACLFNSSIYDALIGDFFCVALGLLLALGLQQRQLAVSDSLPRLAA